MELTTEAVRAREADKREAADCLEEVTLFEVVDLELLAVPALVLVTTSDCGGGFAAFSVSTVMLTVDLELVKS